MISLAILHATLPSYMAQAEGDESKHLKVVAASTNLDEFEAMVIETRPQVMVLDLTLLGSQPEAALARLEQRVSPELSLVVYAFAKWEVIEQLRGAKRQVMRAPISVRAMRASLVNLIVRQMTKSQPAAAVATSGIEPGRIPRIAAPRRRFDDVQLVGLQEIQSVVDCECPNQVADLILALNAFENYSAQCQNRNAADAEIHAMLARVTGHARAIMEAGLVRLCEFEKIDVDRLPRRSVGVA